MSLKKWSCIALGVAFVLVSGCARKEKRHRVHVRVPPYVSVDVDAPAEKGGSPTRVNVDVDD